MCHSGNNYTDPFPWVALQYDAEMHFTKVVVHNRRGYEERTKNMKIFACSGLPNSVSEYVAGCQEFASFQGPGVSGEAYTFEGAAVGKVLVIQMETNIINLQEIEAYGQPLGKLSVSYHFRAFVCSGQFHHQNHFDLSTPPRQLCHSAQ